MSEILTPKPIALRNNETSSDFSVEILVDSRRRFHWFLEPMDSKVFACVVTTFVIFSLLGIACLNAYVDPFGQYATRRLPPLIQDSRSEKYALFDAMEFKPDGLILGSSRMMKFEPSYLKSKTGLSSFNFAVNHGRPEDFLAILRCYWDRYGTAPQCVLLGVDIASLNDVVPSDARLSAEPNLHRFVRPDLPWSEELDRYCELISYQQSSASIKSIQFMCGFRKRKAPEEQFDSTGVIQYVARQSQREAGTYNLDAAIAYNEREFLSIFGSLKHVSSTRLGYLRDVASFCRRHRSRLFLLSTVHHPRLRSALSSKSDFDRIEKHATTAIKRIADESGAHFIDFGTVESFGGNAEAFVDGIHPLESNTRRMIDCMLPSMNEALYAF